jgi:predicted Fe-Mo cluster-binding NifX family protein
MVAHHFGHAPEFVIYTIEDGRIIKIEIIKHMEYEQMASPKMMAISGITHVIADCIGKRAQEMLKEMKINVYPCVSGTVSDAIRRFQKGELKSSSEPSGKCPCEGEI